MEGVGVKELKLWTRIEISEETTVRIRITSVYLFRWECKPGVRVPMKTYYTCLSGLKGLYDYDRVE